MDKRELVRIDLQLPASALDSLSRLAEQLRLLTDAVSGSPERSARPAQERAENTSFDELRFRNLQPETRSALPMEQGASAARDPEPAVPVHASIMKEVRAPESAGREAVENREGTAPAAPPGRSDIPNAEQVVSDLQNELVVQAVRKASEEDLEEIPAVRPEMEQNVPDPPAVRHEEERQITEANTEKARMPSRDLPLSVVREDITAGIESPVGAGMVVTAEPDVPQSRWAGITEELVTPGPAPLTAESVSLAFQRDGRRYDNGFPLY